MGAVSGSAPSHGDVTVVVVTWNQRDLVLDCLASVARQSYPCRVLVVDNASTDGTVAAVRTAFPGVEVVETQENLGFAGGVAKALPLVQTRFVALLNNDAVADDEWLAASMRRFDDPTVAAVTARMMFPDPSGTKAPTTVNNAGVVLLASGYGADRGLGEPADAVSEPADVFGFSGGAAVLRTLAVLAVGGISPGFFMYYEDTDLSWRLRLAGWRVVYEPSGVVQHRHAASSDVRSESFAFHNERNRLRTLARNAPLRVVAVAALRFVATTVSLSAKRAARRTVPADPVFRTGLRLRVMRAAVADVPAAVRERAARPTRRTARDVWSHWSGVPARDTVSRNTVSGSGR